MARDVGHRTDVDRSEQFYDGAREVPCGARVSKTIGKVRFLEVQGGGNAFFCSEHRKFMKMDRGKLGTPQIDPRGSKNAGILAIRSYRAGPEAQKLDILMLTKRGALIGRALL